MQHRRDIDGLRAIAVVPVVLYHAGVPVLRGGFVGVDVFFVISGFLITGLLVRDLEGPAGRIALAEFYARRIRRILPALLGVLVVSGLLALVILLPRDLDAFARSLVATAVFASNIFFHRQSGYFDGDSHDKPLLHTWSLAVEEQFYLFFPLVLLLLVRAGFAGPRLRHALMALTGLSFAWSLWQLRVAPSAAFYLAPARAWELLLGGLLAVGAVPRLAPIAANAAALLGLLLLGVGFVLITPESAFPGVLALLPCVGAALLIHGGPATAVARALAHPLLVGIGAISYGLYLWHWPLLVLARQWSLAPLTILQTSAVVGVAVALSVLSLRYIEAPFRIRRTATAGGSPAAAPARAFAGGAAATAALLVAGLLAIQSDGWPARVPAAAIAFDAARGDVNARRAECHAHDGHQVPYRDSCRFGASGRLPQIAIWGDSHGVELAVALGEAAAATGDALRLLSYSACPPGSVRGGARGGTGGCAAHNRATRDALAADTAVHTIILVARYHQAVHEQGESYFDALGEAARVLVDAGKHVVLVYPAPEYPFSVPIQLAKATLRGQGAAAVGVPRRVFDRQRAPVVLALDAIRRRVPVDVVDLADPLCDAGRCRTAADGQALYFDDDHLSVSGARFVAPAFAAALGFGSIATRGTAVALTVGTLTRSKFE